MCQVACGRVFPVVWGVSPGLESLGHMVTLVDLLRTRPTVLRCDAPLHIPSSTGVTTSVSPEAGPEGRAEIRREDRRGGWGGRRAGRRRGGGPVRGPRAGVRQHLLRYVPSLCPEDRLRERPPGPWCRSARGSEGTGEGWPQGLAAESPCPDSAVRPRGPAHLGAGVVGTRSQRTLAACPSPSRVFHSCQGRRVSLETTLCTSIGTFMYLEAFASPD